MSQTVRSMVRGKYEATTLNHKKINKLGVWWATRLVVGYMKIGINWRLHPLRLYLRAGWIKHSGDKDL